MLNADGPITYLPLPMISVLFPQLAYLLYLPVALFPALHFTIVDLKYDFQLMHDAHVFKLSRILLNLLEGYAVFNRARTVGCI